MCQELLTLGGKQRPFQGLQIIGLKIRKEIFDLVV